MSGLLATGNIDQQAPIYPALQNLHHRGSKTIDDWKTNDGSICLAICSPDPLPTADDPEEGVSPSLVATNESGTIYCICDGVVTNYSDLRKRLEIQGHTISTNLNHEVIVHSYEMWSEACLDYIDGQFSFILWDSETGFLMASRDRVGTKPLYYAAVDLGVIVASEISAILPLLPELPELDPKCIGWFMALGYVPSPYTLWKGIFKVEPGQHLGWRDRAGLRVRRYWEPPRSAARGSRSDGEWAQLMSRVLPGYIHRPKSETGILINGLSSCATLADILKEEGTVLPAYGVNGMVNIDAVKRVTDTFNMSLNRLSINMSNKMGEDELKAHLEAYDEPQSHASLVQFMGLKETVSDSEFDVRSLLSTIGSEFVLGGAFSQLENKQKGGFGGFFGNKRSKAEKRFANNSPLHGLIWQLHGLFLPDEIGQLIESEEEVFDDEWFARSILRFYVEKLDSPRAIQRLSLLTYCSDVFLYLMDRTYARANVNLLYPFFDRTLIDWGISRPVQRQEEKTPNLLFANYSKARELKLIEEMPLTNDQVFTDLPLEINTQQAIKRIKEGFLVENGYLKEGWQEILSESLDSQAHRVCNLYLLTMWAEVWVVDQPWAIKAQSSQE